MGSALGLRKSVPVCQHTRVQVDVSSHASDAAVNFKRVAAEKRVAATTPSGRVVGAKSDGKHPSSHPPSAYTFPAPLVLPGDSLSIDPKEPPQSLRSFIQEGARNPLTKRRKTLYVGRVSGDSPGPGDVTSQVTKSWTVPLCSTSKAGKRNGQPQHEDAQPKAPKTDDIIEYISAYYHPLEVKSLHSESSSPARFVEWDQDGDATTNCKPAESRSRRKGAKIKASGEKQPTYVGLQLGEGVTRVRTRPCPDGAFSRQINLNDVMDALLEAIPADAHAAILLVDQDMYDDEEDVFCCGLAYGGSRVAVVSTARYHPSLDASHSMDEDLVDRGHMWPGSHCQEFVERFCEAALEGQEEEARDEEGPKRKKAKVSKGKGSKKSVKGCGETSLTVDKVENTPIGAAIKAALAAPGPEEDLSGLWFSRVARTAAHELGHCFCMGHCVYYACSMQGTSCLAEDMRQPPYLCPVCLAKLARAILDVHKELDVKEFVLQRYRALSKFCAKKTEIAMFAGFHAWLEGRIKEVALEEY
ncbi:hypothetical protein V8F20_012543 [Naviculisporaceae sp. PSN 640]